MLRPVLLVVDDDRNVLDVLGVLLSDRYDVVTATSGREALDLVAADGAPDGALVDVMMAGMDGFELVGRLRLLPGCDRLPVVMLTALDDAAHRQRAHDLEVAAYLTKPFEPALLEATLSLHVRAGSIFP